MRTCPKCGCYVPDKWITCPACDTRVKIGKEALSPYPFYNTVSKGFSNSVYQVKIHYKDGSITNTVYGLRENALKSAQKNINKFWYCIKTIEVFDCNTKQRIGIFYPNT